jgi:hypothetical protein
MKPLQSPALIFSNFWKPPKLLKHFHFADCDVQILRPLLAIIQYFQKSKKKFAFEYEYNNWKTISERLRRTFKIRLWVLSKDAYYSSI